MTETREQESNAPGVAHLSLPDSVHRALRRKILNNELGAGTRLVEASLAEEMGVSRATIRVALRQLAQEGLVEIAPRRHSIVTRMSYAEIDDVCYARYVLEEGALRAVVDDELNGLADQLDEVTDLMLLAADAEDLAAVVNMDTRYHGCIVQQSKKQRLHGLWSTLDGQMGALMRSSLEDQHIGLVTAAERHRELTAVIRQADRQLIAEKLYTHYVRMPTKA